MIGTDELTPEQLRAHLQQIGPRFPALQAVYLFGSVAEGRARPDSDVDLALVGPAEALRARYLALLQALVEAGLERADPVLLEEADVVLTLEALRPNCLLYARPDFDVGSYFSRTIRRCWDELKYLKPFRRNLQQYFLRSGSDGTP